uniref:Peptidase A2 domain-containing protein n=1 Tax=Strongyloides stercoralis TaxID=6248 RepID=A0A0K0EMM6_STRER
MVAIEMPEVPRNVKEPTKKRNYSVMYNRSHERLLVIVNELKTAKVSLVKVKSLTNKCYTALVNSGAGINVISSRMVKELGLSLSKSLVKVKIANGQEMRSRGRVETILNIQSNNVN